ncbi:hypothetical protein BC828DRAFT_376969 [Blastocladiella britannica]|nr:hypothetical protein BC828DRAFT_376969 [Blastocladiella britannica]
MTRFTCCSLLLLLALAMTSQVSAHSRLIHPPPRDASLCAAADAKNNCPPCGWNGDKSVAKPAAIRYGRGDVVPMQWPRNNHPGGFIALAVVPFTSSQTFDDFNTNIVQYNCHEAGGCASWDPVGHPLGADPANFGEDQNMCASAWTVPSWMPDGQYTMQWKWFGGGSYFGDLYRGVSDWQNCVDFTVAGGSAVDAGAKPACPLFKPGDASNAPALGVCRYFGDPEPMGCFPQGCSGSYAMGIPKALQSCLAAHPSTTISSTQASAVATASTETPSSIAPSTTTTTTTTNSAVAVATTTADSASTTTTSAPASATITTVTVTETVTETACASASQGAEAAAVPTPSPTPKQPKRKPHRYGRNAHHRK